MNHGLMLVRWELFCSVLKGPPYIITPDRGQLIPAGRKRGRKCWLWLTRQNKVYPFTQVHMDLYWYVHFMEAIHVLWDTVNSVAGRRSKKTLAEFFEPNVLRPDLLVVQLKALWNDTKELFDVNTGGYAIYSLNHTKTYSFLVLCQGDLHTCSFLLPYANHHPATLCNPLYPVCILQHWKSSIYYCIRVQTLHHFMSTNLLKYMNLLSSLPQLLEAACDGRPRVPRSNSGTASSLYLRPFFP